MTGDARSVGRILRIAECTLREAARHRLLAALVAPALLLVMAARWMRGLNIGAAEPAVLADCGFGAMALFGAALTVAATAHFFTGEIERGTALVVLARPVTRAEFVAGKYLAVVGMVAVFCFWLTGLLAAMLWWREGALVRDDPNAFPGGRTLPIAGVVLAGFLQWLKCAVLAALTFIVAGFARTQLFTVLAGGGLLVICHLQHLAQEVYARDSLPAVRMVARIVAAMVPNFHLFSAADVAGATDGWGASDFVRVLLYGAGYVAVAVALAAVVFRRREL